MITKNTQSMGEYVYEQIKNAIVNLKFEPNSKLSEDKLAKMYEVSRTPVKYALNILQQEDLVVVKPQSGTFVSPISYEKAKNIREIRLLLEPYAAKVATQKIPDSVLLNLKEHFEKLKRMSPNSVEKRIFVTEVDVLMHDLILDYCENPEISKIIRDFRPITQRLSISNLKWRDRTRTVEIEMKKVYETLQARDPQQAYEAMYEHIQNIVVKEQL